MTLKRVREYGLPVALMIAGILMFIAQLNDYDWLGVVWPFFIILPGIPMLYVALNSKRESTIRLIFPGMIVTGTGILLLYQAITEHWHSWTYAWALYAVFFGIGLYYQGKRLDNKADRSMGRNLILGGTGVFALLWMLFEGVIFSGTFTGAIGYALAAVLFGSGLVWGGYALRQARSHARRVVESVPTAQPAAESTAKRVQPASNLARLEEAEEPEANDELEEAFAILQNVKEPQSILIEGAEPSAEVDPDLQRKIDAALSGDE